MLDLLFKLVLFLTAVFLILLVLVQRGKGGGLAGAFGGLGGQSAFGTKAGDTFTRITIGVAAFWILLCIVSVPMLASAKSRVRVGSGATTAEQGAEPGTSGDESTSGATSETSGDNASAPPAGGDSAAGTGSPKEGGKNGDL